MVPECRHIKNSGRKCASPALRDRPLCYYHWRQRERAAERQACPVVPLSRVLANLEDRSAIQHAVSQVLMALADYQIDTKRAGIMLYGLQLASSNAKDAEQIVSSESIAELTRTEQGEELAPEGTTSSPPQQESIADLLMREVVRQNPDFYEEYVPGQPLQPKQNKDLSQKQPEGVPPPTHRKQNQAQSDGENEDLPELLADWPLDDFGHPKPRLPIPQFPSQDSTGGPSLPINPPSTHSPQSP